MQLTELGDHLDTLLDASRLKDYCPNGLQVEGRPEVLRVLCGVTASQALLDLAVAGGHDAVFVHHGLFWKGDDGRVTGFRRRRLRTLLANDISLFAYHLPLDVHPELGNNAQLARRMGWQGEARFADQELGWIGRPARVGERAHETARALAGALGREPLLVGDGERAVRRIAWCTGGAQGYFEAAIAAGADAFITGEISEPQAHYAREMGVAFLACGHHATERYGAPAVAGHVAAQLGLKHEFIDIDNPA